MCHLMPLFRVGINLFMCVCVCHDPHVCVCHVQGVRLLYPFANVTSLVMPPPSPSWVTGCDSFVFVPWLALRVIWLFHYCGSKYSQIFFRNMWSLTLWHIGICVPLVWNLSFQNFSLHNTQAKAKEEEERRRGDELLAARMEEQVSRVTHVNESCHTYEWAMSNANGSCHTHEWVWRSRYVISHMRMSHVAYTIESCHVHECVMPHIYSVTRRPTCWCAMSRIRTSHVSYVDASCHTNECVMEEQVRGVENSKEGGGPFFFRSCVFPWNVRLFGGHFLVSRGVCFVCSVGESRVFK